MSAPGSVGLGIGGTKTEFSPFVENNRGAESLRRIAIARGSSISRLSDALAVDFGPHRGDPVLGGPDQI